MEILLFLWSVGNFFLQGFVFMQVWNWFPSELFGVSTINLAGSLGLLLIVRFFRSGKMDSMESTVEDRLSRYINLTFLYAMIFVVGCIIHIFI